MKKVILSKLGLLNCLLLITSLPSYSQDFTWIKGTSLTDQAGVYGNIGITTPSNNPGGREAAISWKDANGDFWLFGGDGFDYITNYGLLSDLWKYNVATNQWTWVKGGNVIAQIGAYGTQGISSPSNKPGGRSTSVSWIDASGNLWLFGGFGYDGTSALGYLNDLWKYNPTSNEWTWMSGSGLTYQPANYGTIGVSSPTNIPGARYGAVSWTDAANDLYLFGGFGNTTSSTTIGALNDMWKYTIATNEWTWVKGTNLIDQNGVYGSQGSASPTNMPGGRSSAINWKDASGNFWIFGGDGWDATSTTGTGLLSDLWKFDKTTGQWAWVKGNNTVNQQGVYGFQGTGNPANIPGGRSGATSWIDAVGSLWMFAGEGYDGSTSTSTVGGLNDLWKYNIPTNEWTWVRGSSVLDQHGNYGSQGVPAFTNIPGARNLPVSWIDASSNLWFFGGYGQPAAGGAGSLNDLWKYTNCFISPITMTIVSGDSIICAGESTSLTASGSNNFQWTNPGLATTPYVVINPGVTTTYSVYTSNSNGCKYMAAFTETVLACAGINKVSQNKQNYLIYPNPNNGEFKLSGLNVEGPSRFEIYDALGRVVFEQQINQGDNMLKCQLIKGLYYYQVKVFNQITGSGKLVIE